MALNTAQFMRMKHYWTSKQSVEDLNLNQNISHKT